MREEPGRERAPVERDFEEARWEREELRLRLEEDFFFGTFAPDLRASERPMAMACLRLVTFLPLRPLFSVPALRSRMARSTLLPALGLYLRPAEDFFAAAIVKFSLPLNGKRRGLRGLRGKRQGLGISV